MRVRQTFTISSRVSLISVSTDIPMPFPTFPDISSEILTQRWELGEADRGLGRSSYAIMSVDTKEVVMEVNDVRRMDGRQIVVFSDDLANHIIDLHNDSLKTD